MKRVPLKSPIYYSEYYSQHSLTTNPTEFWQPSLFTCSMFLVKKYVKIFWESEFGQALLRFSFVNQLYGQKLVNKCNINGEFLLLLMGKYQLRTMCVLKYLSTEKF